MNIARGLAAGNLRLGVPLGGWCTIFDAHNRRYPVALQTLCTHRLAIQQSVDSGCVGLHVGVRSALGPHRALELSSGQVHVGVALCMPPHVGLRYYRKNMHCAVPVVCSGDAANCTAHRVYFDTALRTKYTLTSHVSHAPYVCRSTAVTAPVVCNDLPLLRHPSANSANSRYSKAFGTYTGCTYDQRQF